MKYLVDRSIEVISRTTKPIRHELNFGGIINNPSLSFQPCVHNPRFIDDIDALARIAETAFHDISLYTYTYLRTEAERATMEIGYSYLFDFKIIQHLSTSLDESFFNPVWNDDYIKKENLVEFVKFLTTNDQTKLIELGMEKDFSPALIQQLQKLHFLKNVCNGVAESHYADLFHLWTGDCFKLNGFLTVDYKLCNLYRNTLNNPVGLCAPITPKEVPL